MSNTNLNIVEFATRTAGHLTKKQENPAKSRTVLSVALRSLRHALVNLAHGTVTNDDDDDHVSQSKGLGQINTYSELINTINTFRGTS